MMVKALEEIIRRAEGLPAPEQEALASIIKAELDDEAAWQKRFAETTLTLDKLVARAKKQCESGAYGDFDAN